MNTTPSSFNFSVIKGVVTECKRFGDLSCEDYGPGMPLMDAYPEIETFTVKVTEGCEQTFVDWMLERESGLMQVGHSSSFCAFDRLPQEIVVGAEVSVSFDQFYYAYIDRLSRLAKNLIDRRVSQVKSQLDAVSNEAMALFEPEADLLALTAFFGNPDSKTPASA